MRTPIQHGVSWKIAGLLLAAAAFGAPRMASADIVHNDDVIIIGSLNVGFDAVNGKNFGFDTIILSENNLRVKFEDTSNSASFPSNDWRLVANDSTNGGLNFFAIEDAETGRDVIKAEAGARANALYVEADGDIGVGTDNPAVDVDIKTGNSPTVRLQQDGTNGFTPQTWDMSGNETNYFIRDVTNGSLLPFRIRPDSPTDTLELTPSEVVINEGSNDQNTRIEGNGDANLFFVDAGQDRIGMGTNAPSSLLHLVTAGTAQIILEGTSNQDVRHTLRPDEGVTEQWSMVVDAGGSNVLQLVRGALTNAHLWQINNTGDVTATTFNGVSSRALKQDIRDLEAEKAIAALRELTPVEYAYKSDPSEAHVGFIAEDVPELVANNDRKSISSADVVAVVTKVVKEQQATIAELQARLEKLEQGQ